MKTKKERKQFQWTIILISGVLLMIGSAGHLETGGGILSTLSVASIGFAVALWGLNKLYKWGGLEDEETEEYIFEVRGEVKVKAQDESDAEQSLKANLSDVLMEAARNGDLKIY